MRLREPGIAVPLGAFAAFVVGGALVGLRGAVSQSVVALALGIAVALAGRFLGRAGGVAAALSAGLIFDFAHTRPYLSLKIADGTDVLATVALVGLGLIVGGLAAALGTTRDRIADGRTDAASLARVLRVAGSSVPEDVELSVRAELLGLLPLQECWFTPASVPLPDLGPDGSLPGPIFRMRPGGFELPPAGFVVPVEAHGERLGSVVCVPATGVGVAAERCRSAVALGRVLGLAIAASPRAA
jgi:hypothetical protein